MKYCIVNGKIILNDQIVEKNLWIQDEKIINITDETDPEATVIDVQGNFVSPGFIDVHTHGKNGSDAMNATFEDLDNLSVSNIKTGVTGFLPTTMTQSQESTYAAIKNIAENKDKVNGARIIGTHMEGPFFNIKHKGAQPGEYIVDPSIEMFDKMTGEYSEVVKLLSLAPEMPGSDALTKYLLEKGITVSLGHTGATYDEGKKLLDLGADHFTHTYNAMTPLNHRNPGIVGLAMDSDQTYAELILDGHHVSAPAARILYHAKGEDYLTLITDSMEACMKDPGTYQLGGQGVTVENGTARLKDGTLAGSILCMNDAVKNAMDYFHIDIVKAVRLASLNPAKSIKVEDQLGSIAVGKLADIIIFDDQVRLKHAFVNGKLIY